MSPRSHGSVLPLPPPPVDPTLAQQFAAHEVSDAARFAQLETKLAGIRGQLTLVIALVLTSGAVNLLIGHGSN